MLIINIVLQCLQRIQQKLSFVFDLLTCHVCYLQAEI